MVWPLYLGFYYIEFALMVFHRPELHRFWGSVLVLFHFGTFLFMSISFPAHVLINSMLLIFSPFAPKSIEWRRAVVLLPGITLMRLLWSRVVRPTGPSSS